MIAPLSKPLDKYQAPSLPSAETINLNNNIKNFAVKHPLGRTGPLEIFCDVTPVCLVQRPNHCVHVSMGLTHQAIVQTIAVLEIAAVYNLTSYEDLYRVPRGQTCTSRPMYCAGNGDLLH